MTFDEAEKELKRIGLALDERYAGKKAVITSDYNGQPYGSSRRSLKGETVIIECVVFDGCGGIHVFLQGHRVGLRPTELRVLEGE